jgi:hypothetical protein
MLERHGSRLCHPLRRNYGATCYRTSGRLKTFHFLVQNMSVAW